MPNIDSHRPGDFCWIELATSDQSGAKNFYTRLLGWAADDSPMGPDEFYTMFKIDGRTAGAAYTLRAEQKAQGVPPHWGLYIAVESADAAVAKAAELGGTALGPAFDVMDVGRMGVIQDPTGATFCVWQAKQHIGTQIAGVDGTLCWADLSTSNQDAASEFYSGLFGWTIEKEDEEPEHRYYHIKNGEEYIGGIPPAAYRDAKMPPHWMIYLKVTECDAATTRAVELGAKVFMPPRKVDTAGRMSVVADPQGAVFALFAPTK
jgi:uncharacterized protein